MVDFVDPVKVSNYNCKFIATIACLSTNIGDDFDASEDITGGKCCDVTGYQYKYQNSDTLYYCNNISNVIEFKSFVYSTTTVNSEKVQTVNILNKDYDNCPASYVSGDADDEIYQRATYVFNNSVNIEKTSFVNKTGANSFEKNDDTIVMMNTFDAENVTSIVYFVEYNYNEDFIDMFHMSNELMTSGLSEFNPAGKEIDFFKDIASIELNSTTEEKGGDL